MDLHGRTRLRPYWRRATADEPRLLTRIAWGRVALTGVALLVVAVAPGVSTDRSLLTTLLLVLWLPASLLQLLLVRLLHGKARRLLSIVVDIGVITAFVFAVPQPAIAPILALTVFVALYSVLDSYQGGLLATGFASAGLAVATQVGSRDRITSVDVALFVGSGLSTTALVGYVAESSRVDVHNIAASYGLAQNRLALSLEAAEMGLWEWDIVNDHVDWSAETLRIFGCDEPPADAAAFLALVHPEDREMLERQIQAALETGGSYQVHHRAVVDGRTRWLIGKGKVSQGKDGSPQRLIGVVTDVSQQREQQLQLERSRRLETVSGLAGGFAHDFNNVLGVIMMTAEVLRRSDLDDAQRERVDFLIEAARRGAAVSDKLLAFARREPGHPVPLRLHTLVNGIVPLLARALRADITLVVDIPESLPSVAADPALLEQALLNLAVNARDALPARGEVRLTAREGTVADSPMVLLEVTDNGVGMTADVAERALEPFFTTKGPHHGTGLGLASVYSTVSALGGTVDIESEVGRGTTVRLSLPASAVDPVADSREVDRPGTTTGARVLVVDDDPGIRETLRDMLAGDGHEVATAADGRAALRLFDEQSDLALDVIVTDIVMPELSGPDLAAELDRRGIATPVVFMTGYVDRDPTRADEAGVLRKPFSAAQLRAAVNTALMRSTAAPPPTG